MTVPEVDSELERLFVVARQETQPDAGARARVRAGIARKLSTSAAPTTSARHAWLGAGGVAALALGGIALWLNGAAPPRPIISSPALAPSAELAPGAPAPAASLEVTPPVAPIPCVAAPAAKGPALKPPVASAKPPSSTPPTDPAEELTLVRSMQQALRAGNASQALTLAAEHARRFPSGALVEEREGVRAIAQCQLAAPEARAALLSAFTRRFGGSPYAARVKAACQ